MPPTPAIQFDALTKRFGPVTALSNVSFPVAPASVHALIGENGAGKSTLMRLLAGLDRPTSGSILLAGQPAPLTSPRAAQSHGIAMIHQELNLVDELSVADNIFLGRELTRLGLIDRPRQNAEAARLLALLRAGSIRATDRIATLSIAQRQMVEIAKALSAGARILIMDEPTAVLSSREIASLFAVIATLKADGVTILYISHLLSEVLAIADRITILRDGQLVTTLEPEDLKSTTEKHLATLMVGRPMEQHFPTRITPREQTILEVRNLKLTSRATPVSFSVRGGEIFGLAGLIGAGRTELAETIAALRKPAAGQIFLDGKPLRLRSPRDAVAAGIAYLSEDRKGTGLSLGLSVLANLTLASLPKHTSPLGILRPDSELATTRTRIDSLRIRTPSPFAPIDTLSGGNQQKIALAKWLETNPKVLIIDEPTRGVDIGAKEQIYRIIQGLSSQGLACILISSELNEILGLSHRIGVMRHGHLAAILDGPTATEQSIMQLAAAA